MRELPRDLVTILRTEAKNQRTPPIDYVVAEDGGRMVHRPDPDIAMAELLEEAAAALAAKEAELDAERAAREKAEALSRTGAVKAALSGDTGELIDRMAAAIRDWGSHYDDGPWETLPEDRKAGWRGDAERALAVVKEYLTTEGYVILPKSEAWPREALAELVGVITEAFPSLENTPPVLKARAALKEASDERA